jgi:hypothetical protein
VNLGSTQWVFGAPSPGGNWSEAVHPSLVLSSRIMELQLYSPVRLHSVLFRYLRIEFIELIRLAVS